MDKFQGYLRASEGKVLEFSDYVLEFHAVRLEELASCRHIVEKIPDLEIGTHRCGRLYSGDVLRISEVHLATEFVTGTAGFEGDLCHGGYGCQGFPTESEGGYVVQVLCCGDFGGCVPFEGQNSLIRRHPAAVVDDLDDGASCILYNDAYLARTGVHCVLHQFFDHRRRPLHHLSGGYHIGNVAW